MSQNHSSRQEIEQAYLISARKEFKKKLPDCQYPRSHWRWNPWDTNNTSSARDTQVREGKQVALLSMLYERGRNIGSLKIDFREFVHKIYADSYVNYYWEFPTTVGRKKRKQWHFTVAKERTKFQKQHYIQKKILSEKEISKRDWRKKKKRRQDHQKSYRVHCPKWLKRYCNKTHRAFERRCMEREQYDRLFSKSVPKDLFDPWDWD